MAILNAGIVAPTGGYQISRSLRFNSADSAYLNRTPGSAGNRRTWTWSGWVKRAATGFNSLIECVGPTTPTTRTGFMIQDQDKIHFFTDNTSSSSLISTQVFRDFSAWYHIICAVDTSQATSSNRVKIYVNGSQITAFSTANYPSQNLDTQINNTQLHTIGKVYDPFYANMYLTEINFIDGQALTPSSFGETDTDTGVWKPKKYTGSYSGNSFYLNFSDNSGTTSTTLGKDSSGLGNNWTPNNFSVTAGAGNDSLVDTPTNYGTDTGVGGEVRGNYCTWNPLDKQSTNITVSNGNLNASMGLVAESIRATMGMSSGKWYWENTVVTLTGNLSIGILNGAASLAGHVGQNANGWAYWYDGRKVNNNSFVSYGSSYTTNDVIGVAFDADNGSLTFYKNGVSQGVAYTGLVSNTYFPAMGNGGSAIDANFGQRPFAYTAPSGFKALCTQNLPEPTIKDGGDYFNTVLYTGTGSTQSITGVGFQPDLLWIKSRSNAANHGLHDVLRVISGNEAILYSNLTDAESTGGAYLSSFDSNGFTVNSNSSGNGSGQTYVAWNWKANGAGSSNTAGTITSTVSVNTTSGFSIVTYTGNGTSGATVGHGLGVAPSMVIIKARTQPSAHNWVVGHSSLNYSTGQYIVLNLTNAVASASTIFNNTAPSSSVVTLGNFGWTNGSTYTYVMYAFAPVAGYSAFGSYTGNGSADGPFIFTNHRPAFVLIKRTDTTSNWTILDFQREGYNVDNDPLYPNLTNAEGTTDLADLLSNGFKLRTTDASVNASGGTYIYMSLASNPFKYSLAR